LKLSTNLHKLYTRTCSAFTFMVLVFTIIMYTASNQDTKTLFATSAEMILLILLFSFIYALTGLLYDNWKASEAIRRLMHFLLNFVNIWLCFFLISGRMKLVKEFIITGFVYMVLYVIMLGIIAGIKKIKEKLE